MSLSDLEFTAVKILRTKKHIVTTFSKDWDYWLIDEYQDTTPLQAEILNRLRGASKEFCSWGIPKQSIYLFRGARSEVFDKKQSQINATHSMDKNYRSHPSLLYFFNDFFKNMEGDFPKNAPWR